MRNSKRCGSFFPCLFINVLMNIWTAAGCGFIGAAFLAENIRVVAGRGIHRMGFVPDYVGVIYRLGGQMRLGTRFAENKQKPVFRRECGKESVIFRLRPGNIF